MRQHLFRVPAPSAQGCSPRFCLHARALHGHTTRQAPQQLAPQLFFHHHQPPPPPPGFSAGAPHSHHVRPRPAAGPPTMDRPPPPGGVDPAASSVQAAESQQEPMPQQREPAAGSASGADGSGTAGGAVTAAPASSHRPPNPLGSSDGGASKPRGRAESDSDDEPSLPGGRSGAPSVITGRTTRDMERETHLSTYYDGTLIAGYNRLPQQSVLDARTFDGDDVAGLGDDDQATPVLGVGDDPQSPAGEPRRRHRHSDAAEVYEIAPILGGGTPDEELAPEKFGTWDGVWTRCMGTILGVLLFVRMGWVVGQAGVGLTVLIILLSVFITLLTTMSTSAIATNGRVEGGGSYFLISRSAGPALGTAIGVLFMLGQTVAVSMYIIGFAETMVSQLGVPAPGTENASATADMAPLFTFTGEYINDVRIWGILLVTLQLGVLLVGIGWVVRLQVVLLALVLLTVVSVVLGAAVGPDSPAHSWNSADGAPGFTGFGVQNATCQEYATTCVDAAAWASSSGAANCSSNNTAVLCASDPPTFGGTGEGTCMTGQDACCACGGGDTETLADMCLRWATNLQANLGPAFTCDGPSSNWYDGSPGNCWTFWSVFAIFFPAATGILAGAGISNKLQQPERNIPVGTFHAVADSTLIYIGAAVTLGAAVSREELIDNYLVMQSVEITTFLVSVGIYSGCFSAAVASLSSAPQLLGAVAKDRLLPFLAPFAQQYFRVGFCPRRSTRSRKLEWCCRRVPFVTHGLHPYFLRRLKLYLFRHVFRDAADFSDQELRVLAQIDSPAFTDAELLKGHLQSLRSSSCLPVTTGSPDYTRSHRRCVRLRGLPPAKLKAALLDVLLDIDRLPSPLAAQAAALFRQLELRLGYVDSHDCSDEEVQAALPGGVSEPTDQASSAKPGVVSQARPLTRLVDSGFVPAGVLHQTLRAFAAHARRSGASAFVEMAPRGHDKVPVAAAANGGATAAAAAGGAAAAAAAAARTSTMRNAAAVARAEARRRAATATQTGVGVDEGGRPRPDGHPRSPRQSVEFDGGGAGGSNAAATAAAAAAAACADVDFDTAVWCDFDATACVKTVTGEGDYDPYLPVQYGFVQKEADPILAYFPIFFLAVCCISVGSLNVIAPLQTTFFLITYGMLNLACVMQVLSKNPGWRPAFQCYHWTGSLLGAALCVAAMLVLDWVSAVITLVITTLIATVLFAIPLQDTVGNWGDATEAAKHVAIRSNLLGLRRSRFHPRTFRPAYIMLLPEHPNPRYRGLVRLAYTLGKGYSTAHVGIVRVLRTDHDGAGGGAGGGAAGGAGGDGGGHAPDPQERALREARWLRETQAYYKMFDRDARREEACDKEVARLMAAQPAAAHDGGAIEQEQALRRQVERAQARSVGCGQRLRECRRSRDRMWAMMDYVSAPDFRNGARQLLQLCGVGPLRPNTLLAELPRATDTTSPKDLALAVDRLYNCIVDAVRMDMCVVVAQLHDHDINFWEPRQLPSRRHGCDVWWVMDDNGFQLLVPRQLMRSDYWQQVTGGCKVPVRYCALNNARLSGVNDARTRHEDMLSSYRLPWPVEVVPVETIESGRVVVELARVAAPAIRAYNAVPYAEDLDKQGLSEKHHQVMVRWLAVAAVIRRECQDSNMVCAVLPHPRKWMRACNYIALLDVLTSSRDVDGNMIPSFLSRGNSMELAEGLE